jgi:hypothetical protein
LCSILLQHTNSPRVGLDSHFSGGSVSFRDYTPLVKINMYAPDLILLTLRGNNQEENMAKRAAEQHLRYSKANHAAQHFSQKQRCL